ncbi:Protein nud1 [Knufia obscura]|uniref:Protein nud1 n=1 Tax=Knufia obscura TaxID=1635080 RepID=A0ABR0S401_9EURO|nr:Protein nud1 [Knufia obscura]
MAEPWLDGLSEEWESQPRSSPPSASQTSKGNTSRRVSSIASQSRIPHLAHNIRNPSNGSSFLKPRSSRGIARQQENNALTERSPASLNAMASSPPSASKRRVPSTIPRRASSALSDSQNSVQHYTINKSSKLDDTPEWKRRLIKEGNNIDSDGLDLFSPSKLEGMFKQSSCPVEIETDENDESVVVTEKKPWNSLNNSAFPPPSATYSSCRTSRSRPSVVGTLQNIVEEEDKSFDLSAISSDVVRQGDINGIVRRRVSSLELADATNRNGGSIRTGNDPRMRTISGRKEISDEVFSELEDSERSSIRRQALQDTLDTDPVELRKKLREARGQSSQRSRSRSSDHDVSYDAQGLNEVDDSMMPEDPAAEITSLSLPEDLSMGTQNYNPSSRHVSNSRHSSAMHRKPLSGNTSQLEALKEFRSSPPPYKHNGVEQSRISISEPTSPVDTSVVHHAPTSGQHSTAGSPLKLFGNRDTYTNNKLMRILSQFEEEPSELEVPGEAAALRMSNFGKGELDAFGFDKEIERPAVEETQLDEADEKVFKDLASLTINGSTAKDATQQPSPTKERSPKRRRTLLKDEMFVDGTEVEIKVSRLPSDSLAGKKRRDALPGKDAEQASPETLASRRIVRPSGSRKSSRDGHSRAASASEALQNATDMAPQLTEQLAAELESFAQNAAEVKQDSRKASLATKDYMEEANKVMEFIRAKGKPKPALPDIQEPEDSSELNPDAILDLDLEDSTKDSFSRPPSREGRIVPRPNRRHAQHDSKTADHLKKFHEPDDLDILTSTSAFGTVQLADNKASEEAALVPVPEEESAEEPEKSYYDESMQSDPPGMRILNDNDKKRKHSSTETDTQNINSDGSRRTVATTSSTASGQRGMISQGTVSIPDTIGVMTFDREKKIWVKQNIKAPKLPRPSVSPESKAGRQEFSEADPFDGIPDLSIDETGEATWKKSPMHRMQEKLNAQENAYGIQGGEQKEPGYSQPKETTPVKSSLKSPRRQRPSEHSGHEERPQSKGSQASRHEERLHNGVPSKEVEVGGKQQQPRVVTIAFSSPIASEIPYVQPPSLSGADVDEDDPSLLPLDDDGSVLASSPAKPQEDLESLTVEQPPAPLRTMMGSLDRHEQYRAMTLNRRPVSRIEEYDEEQEDNQELSLIHIKHNELTPVPERQLSVQKTSVTDKSSLLCLTPLSEFTLHQVDKANHPEESFVAERANPKALRQAHGSAALVEDALVKAITDAEPTELFWEQLRRLSLPNNGLAALRGLSDYCSSLEYLDLTGNKVVQLTGLPVSVRTLNIASNLVNDLTSWNHLHNLQSINVSGNQLESLEAFSGLVHLRHLNASNNKIRNIEGILDLNGLITLDLSGNDIPEADFRTSVLTSLEDLDLSKNNLMHVKNLDCLPKLKTADFTENLLEELIVSGEKVAPRLETLCLAQNELAGLDLTAFPSLQRLNVDGNSITALQGLAEAEHLTVLSARDQQITSTLVNDILAGTHDIAELYVSANALPEAGLALPQQPNFTLRCLEIASCGLDSLPVGFGDHFPNLRVLNMNFNALSELAPLQGCVKLRSLYLAKNRIRKMRRTCLTLSRLQALKRVDVRDNPLTVGFYKPMNGEQDVDTAYRLPSRDTAQDKRWMSLMDEMTWMRRRAMELLLAECCPGVEEVDGLAFDRDVLVKEQAILQRLMRKGVLKEREATVTVSEVGRGQRQVQAV